MFLVTDGLLFTLSAWLIGPGAWVAHWPGVGLVEMGSGSHFRACDGSLVEHQTVRKQLKSASCRKISTYIRVSLFLFGQFFLIADISIHFSNVVHHHILKVVSGQRKLRYDT